MSGAAITRSVIDPMAVLRLVGGVDDGAVLLFLGTVRRHNEGREVRAIQYDAYEAMALPVLQAITAEAAERWQLKRVAAVHRVGTLQVGEISVAIAASAPHRAAVYEAARYVIEEIKRRLPVWKQEHYEAGDSRWLGSEDSMRAGT